MSKCRKIRKSFAESLYREMDMERKQEFDGHLAVCKKCKSEYDDMARTIKVVSERRASDPGQEFWDGYWDRLEKRMKKEGLLQTAPSDADLETIREERTARPVRRRFRFFPRWAYGLAGAAALLTAGVLIGRLFIGRPEAVAQKPGPEGRRPIQQAAAGDLAARTSHYFDRSKVVLLSLLNFDLQTEDPYGLNIPLQKKTSRELVQQAAFLKKDLRSANEKQLERLVSDLEMILLQIANLESENDLSAIEIVKLGVEKKGLIFKINLSELRQTKERGRIVPHPKAKATKF